MKDSPALPPNPSLLAQATGENRETTQQAMVVSYEAFSLSQ
jgi:hypothetical protein